MPTISEWDWNEGNLEELASHGLTPETVVAVALEEPKFRANKRGRAATHQMIGPDRGGKTWVICVKPLDVDEGLWRAVTGWEANDAERDWWNRS